MSTRAIREKLLEKKPAHDKPGTLYKETQKLLAKQNLMEIYVATGIPYFWLRNFRVNMYPNPSVNRVQALYEHLSKTKLLK